MNNKKTCFQDDFYSEIRTFCGTLMDSITKELEKGEKAEPAKMYTVTRLLNVMKDFEAYEKERDADD